MQKHLDTRRGAFIILPDLPSDTNPSLPTLCFRKTNNGLLARVSDSNKFEKSICENVRLFGFQDEEKLDTFTVSEDLVRDSQFFVRVMDGVSSNGFLRDETVKGCEWEELFWLKEKGYYSVGEFLANKLELTLRLSWLNCNGGKKKGGSNNNKLKEKVSVAGIAANVFWRKKGCLDWWAALDPGMKKTIFRTVLAKAAKSTTKEIVKAEISVLVGGKCPSSRQIPSLAVSATDAQFSASIRPAPISGRPVSLSNIFTSLFVLQDICAMIFEFQQSGHDRDNLFYSTLASLHTTSDYILRRFRGRLMVVSSDCIKHELLAGENVTSPLSKSKDKLCVGSRRGRGRSRNPKKLNSVQKSSGVNHAMENSCEDHGCGLGQKEAAMLKAKGIPYISKAKDVPTSTCLSRAVLDHAKGLVDQKVQTTGKKKKSRKKHVKTDASNVMEVVTPEDSEVRSTLAASQCVSLQRDAAVSDISPCDSSVHDLLNDLSIGSDGWTPDTCFDSSVSKHNSKFGSEVTRESEEESVVSFTEDSLQSGCCKKSSGVEVSACTLNSEIRTPVMSVVGLDNNDIFGTDLTNDNSENLSDVAPTLFGVDSKEETVSFQRNEMDNSCAQWPRSFAGSTSYEWPSVAHCNIPFVNSQHLPAATDRLHLDVGCNWRNRFHPSFVSTRHQAISPSIEGGGKRLMPRTLPLSVDWPPMVRSASRLTSSISCSYDSGFMPRLQSTYQQGLTPHRLQFNGTISDDERKFSEEAMESCDFMNAADVVDGEPHWLSEEEFEVHAFSERDYSQYFGGGVMYWNTSDLGGTGCSRPPSLSSEDSSWAWHEADLNRSIDDMVGIPSTYNNNGLTSPPSGTFCSPFDPLGPGQQALGYVMPGSDVTGKVSHISSTQKDGIQDEKVSGSFTNSSGSVGERQNGDLLPYPILRPIIIPNVSRKGSISDFKVSHHHRSPCVPLPTRDQPQIKRPPSPVVLCVPRAPCPPPFSSVVESRKKRGFSTVRSGSSSPRHWGLRSWYHDGNNSEGAGLCVDGAEVIWPSWRSKGLSATPMIQPLPGSLLQDRLIAISQLALDQEHPDAAFPLQPQDSLNCPSRQASLPVMHSLLHDEIDSFCKQVAAKNIVMKPCISWAVKRVARSLQVLWPRSRTNIFGSNVTGLSLPTSDVDLVVCLPPVRNLEPIKEAGILEGRNGIKETCLQHAARYLANQEWVKNDSLKTVENTAIPIIMLEVEVPQDVVTSSGNTSNEKTPKLKSAQINGEESSSDNSDTVVIEDCSWKMCSELKKEEGVGLKSVRLDISFKSPSHTGLQTTELVRELTEQFPAATPLALVLKQFLADRSLDHSYSGGLSSYCLVLLIARFLQHEYHLGRPINQVNLEFSLQIGASFM
ncbi:hypothetical protein IFM89_010250 [Coptis chinensis]|uniref:Poly(A) RNA polymerase mitochondrial-like central palm domain-containing protein n=1 Tax=Coptis chinensis TaxID=261450 RepID=A0A835I924_9MAGN|nr:hypothetical protein IFM89_010250 [Coptis chinensis]